MGMTIAEKVLSAHSGSDCYAGDMTVASVDFCMAQDGTSTMMMRELEALGFEGPRTRRGMALVIDHSSPSPSANISRIHDRIRSFAKAKGIPLCDIGEGVCHQVVPESGKVLPGDLVLLRLDVPLDFGHPGAVGAGRNVRRSASPPSCGRHRGHQERGEQGRGRHAEAEHRPLPLHRRSSGRGPARDRAPRARRASRAPAAQNRAYYIRRTLPEW